MTAKFKKKLEIKAQTMKVQFTAVYYAYQSDQLNLLPKIIVAMITTVLKLVVQHK